MEDARGRMTTNGNPYISFVVVTRNDDHGGDLNARTQAFLESLADLCRRHKLQAELVVVEWNPPSDRPPLREVLRWPDAGGHCEYRIVTVSHEAHARLSNSAELPLFQMIGKNVGIRRARGSYILATNVDLIFSDELGEILASQRLTPGRYYRVDRMDVPADLTKYRDFEKRLEYCRQNVIRVNSKHGTFTPTEWRALQASRWELARSYIRKSISGVWRAYCKRAFGGTSFEDFWWSIYPPNLIKNWLSLTTLWWMLRLPWTILKHAIRLLRKLPAAVRIIDRPHTNACGDFTLMHRHDWHRLRGYAEFEIFSWHLDSLVIYQARGARLKEVILNTPVYHIEHQSGWTPEAAEKLWARLREKSIPFLTNEDLYQYESRLRRRRISHQLNSVDWGMARDEFPEELITSSPAAPIRRAA